MKQVLRWFSEVFSLFGCSNTLQKVMHGSLEAILGRTKLVPNKFHWNPICFFPPQSFRKFMFFSVCQLQGFFWWIFRGQISSTSWKALSRI
jgi:hypothetical protein